MSRMLRERGVFDFNFNDERPGTFEVDLLLARKYRLALVAKSELRTD